MRATRVEREYIGNVWAELKTEIVVYCSRIKLRKRAVEGNKSVAVEREAREGGAFKCFSSAGSQREAKENLKKLVACGRDMGFSNQGNFENRNFRCSGLGRKVQLSTWSTLIGLSL